MRNELVHSASHIPRLAVFLAWLGYFNNIRERELQVPCPIYHIPYPISSLLIPHPVAGPRCSQIARRTTRILLSDSYSNCWRPKPHRTLHSATKCIPEKISVFMQEPLAIHELNASSWRSQAIAVKGFHILNTNGL